MQLLKDYRSPHFENLVIPVEFVVLHYTAQSLKESLNIFLSPKSKVSCHLLIDRDGSTYELVDCWEGKAKKAFHAGESLWEHEAKKWQSFNNFSLGIELVNWNGNFFPFTAKQYESLFEVLTHLKTKYPQLNNPDRLLGHEHIAGFRGKKDPGCLFDWSYLFKKIYKEPNYPNSKSGDLNFEKQNFKDIKTQDYNTDNLKKEGLRAEGQKFPLRESVLTKREIDSLQFLKKSKNWNDKKAKRISLILENKSYPFWFKRLLFYLKISKK